MVLDCMQRHGNELTVKQVAEMLPRIYVETIRHKLEALVKEGLLRKRRDRSLFMCPFVYQDAACAVDKPKRATRAA